MFQLISLSVLVLSAALAPVFANSPAYPHKTTCATRVKTFECRCGHAEFLSLPHANITAPEEARKCASYKLIDARGTAEPQGVSTMFYPMIKDILANTTGGVSQPVEYPAGPDQNTTSGEKFVLDVINQGLRDCPGQSYALFGYSQGATLILNALDQLDAAALSLVKSVILVGNPYRIPNKLSNVNGTAQKDHAESVGMFATSAIQNNSTVPQLSTDVDRSGKALDYCLEGDGVCSYDTSCSCALPAGHLSYGLADAVQNTAFQHVVSRIGKRRTNNPIRN
ncbi:hypothetical protein E8E15_008351 [Penicillium rubens]|uniref:Cutinase n=2 Tax=Penicillium chrysogenum species complex TaxID=254878 RepID=A0A167YLX3_PENCH|nr:hypothetical protein E8E15_008351 [Penicillium rubens]KAJ5035936.1 hypothetical protein NUH16_003801 [Penicillium rubens]KZN94289.1 Cutinase [Penicillium chrysogenum]